MTSTDWRALCTELADALDHNRQCLLNDRRLTHPLADKARAAIAADRARYAHQPAPPAEVAPGPTMEDVGPLIAWLTEQAHQAADASQPTDAGMLTWAAQVIGERVDEDAPAPSAAGEVAELVAWLRLTGEGQPRLSSEGYARLTRAADLLEQRHPVPVPVAERLPGAEDCDAEERCWLLAPRWILPPSELTHWLPATALPLPSGGGAAMSDTNRPPLWRTMEMSTGACAEWQHIILALRFGHRNSEVNP